MNENFDTIVFYENEFQQVDKCSKKSMTNSFLLIVWHIFGISIDRMTNKFDLLFEFELGVD